MGCLAEDVFMYVNYSHVNVSARMAKTRLEILTARQCQQRPKTSDICTYLTMSSYKHAHTHTHMNIHIHICIYVYIHTHVHIFRQKKNNNKKQKQRQKCCWCPKRRRNQLVAPHYIIMCGN